MKRIDLSHDDYELLRSIVQVTHEHYRHLQCASLTGYIRRIAELERIIESTPDVPEHQR